MFWGPRAARHYRMHLTAVVWWLERARMKTWYVRRSFFFIILILMVISITPPPPPLTVDSPVLFCVHLNFHRCDHMTFIKNIYDERARAMLLLTLSRYWISLNWMIKTMRACEHVQWGGWSGRSIKRGPTMTADEVELVSRKEKEMWSHWIEQETKQGWGWKNLRN